MATYLKICSAFEIDEDDINLNGNFFLDYDRQEDEPGERFRYEYFFEPYNQTDDEDVEDFQASATTLIQHLIKTIGSDNFVANNQTGIYIEGC